MRTQKMPIAIDPMALILNGDDYVRWEEMHHPHVPRVAEIEKVLSKMTAEERKAAVSRAREVGIYAQAVQEVAAKMR